MPKVPVYDAPQVSPTGLPEVSAQLDTRQAFGDTTNRAGEAWGHAASQATDAALNVYQHEKQQADAKAVTDAENEFQQRLNKQMWDPDTGVMNSHGENAVANSAGFREYAQNHIDEISEGLSNYHQQDIFRARANSLLTTHEGAVEKHVAEQVQVAKAASSVGYQETSLNTIAKAYDDPELAAKTSAAVEGPIRALALSPQDAEAKIAAWRGKVTSTRLNQYIAAQDYAGAQALFSQERDNLGPDAAHYEHTLSELNTQLYGQTTAAQIVHNSVNPANGFVDETKLQEELAKLPPGPKFKAVEQALNPMREQAERAKKATINQNYLTAFTAYEKGRSLSAVPAQTKAWLIDNAPDEWSKLEDLQLKRVREGRREANAPDTAEERRTKITALNDIAANAREWKKLGDQALPELMAKYGAGLSDKGLEHVSGQLDSLLKNEKNFKAKDAPRQVVQDVLANALQEHSPKPDTWTEDHQGAWNHAYDEVNKRAAEYQDEHNGKMPPREKLEEWAKKTVTKVKVKGSGFLFDDTVTKAEAETNPAYQGKPLEPAEGETPTNPTAAASAPREEKKIRAYRYVKGNRKRGAPVYTDGTVGPIQDL